MIKLLRNHEVRITLIIYVVLSILVSLVAYLWEKRFGYFVFGVCILFVLVYYAATYLRYRHISFLAADIDRILHGNSCQIKLEKYQEGELGILQNEIHKMTVRLHEQQQTLKRDKIYLADSIADISHQIRTPLTSINLIVSLMSDPDITDERRQKLSHDLYELLSRIEWLITTLLKISKLDAGTVMLKKEGIELSELITKAAAPLLVPLDLRSQMLKISAVGRFECDISWTCEAVTNIVKNCMEHTPENGLIEISASDNALYTEIIIEDNGSGIKKDDLPHIFERFYKGKASNDNSFGIGLSLSRMIIAAQNGTVKAENKTSDGAKFTIRFYKGTV